MSSLPMSNFVHIVYAVISLPTMSPSPLTNIDGILRYAMYCSKLLVHTVRLIKLDNGASIPNRDVHNDPHILMTSSSHMSDRMRQQFGAKQGIPRNLVYVGKKTSIHGGQRDWRVDNADKIGYWETRHNRIMSDIEVDENNGLPSEEYKA
ncbi:hypothetical protein AMTR_s00095p00050650 [Amborella trichopoda]|uniref:Uncharacterized protein n=1 Tax=Amborella trichopoda TaxID=13333 RepID=W1NT43_AMBTC|nr:hypothetical protein AMTR_s00095p00050650 [Amborella trichopoda]